MFRAVVEEAAVLASLALFIGMIASGHKSLPLSEALGPRLKQSWG